MMDLIYIVPIIAFFCEFIDSSLGMGYGTSLTPILLLMGFSPLQIVPCVLASEFITGLTASFFHHKNNNVNFSHNSKDTKIAIVLSIFSIIGVIISTIVAVNISPVLLKTIIAIIILSMSFLILFFRNHSIKFSWSKIMMISGIAAFNKGLSGGGYGPLMTGGQMLSGIKTKNAVGITSLAESFTCLIGILSYLIISNNNIDWSLTPYLTLGAICSVPFATLFLQKIPEQIARILVSVAILILGLLTLMKIFF